jgi:hypothetical protein
MRRDDDDRRHGDPRYWGEQRSRDEFLREQENKFDRHRDRDRDQDYLGGRREELDPRGDYAHRGDHDRRQEHERRGDTRSRQGGGSQYRYGEDDYSSRNDQGKGQGQSSRSNDRSDDRQGGQDRDWRSRKEEYGYGRHNYDVFGHEVRRGDRDQDRERLTRGDRGDYESYRRYEQGNRMYDNDYTTGFAGRNYSDRPHYGEDTQYGGDRNINRYDGRDFGRDRGRNDRSGGNGGRDQGRGQDDSYGYYDRNSGDRDR